MILSDNWPLTLTVVKWSSRESFPLVFFYHLSIIYSWLYALSFVCVCVCVCVRACVHARARACVWLVTDTKNLNRALSEIQSAVVLEVEAVNSYHCSTYIYMVEEFGQFAHEENFDGWTDPVYKF